VTNNTIKVIFNPRSRGNSNGEANAKIIAQLLHQANLDYHLEITHYPKHGTELAHHATLEGYQVIVAAGGDGLINEVVNGILQADSQKSPTLGIIPLGTANDLAFALKIPCDLKSACQQIAMGKTKWLDVGQVNGHYFVNNSGIGLEAKVTHLNDQMPQFVGKLSYILAAIKGVLQFEPWEMRLDWPGGSYEGPITLVSIGNSFRTGGGFYMTPHAVPDDGLLDFAFGTWLNRRQVFFLLPQTLYGGHLNHTLVVYKQTPSLKVSVPLSTIIQADGEIIAENATEIEYSIIPQKLQVIV